MCDLLWKLKTIHTLNGPCSVKSPRSELQPGPPFIHNTRGSEAGLLADSKNL